MKKFKLMSMLVTAALLAGFTACSDDDSINGNGNGEEGTEVMANTQVRIVIENGGATSRANNDEIGDGNEVGTANEYMVKNATLYFFDAKADSPNKDKFVQAVDFTGFVKEETVENNKVVWLSQNRQMAAGTYNVVVLVNGKAASAPTANTTTLDAFMKDTKASASTWIDEAWLANAENDGLLMASRNNTNAYVSTITITAENTPQNPAVIETDIERTVAKITLADGQSTPNDYTYSVADQKLGNNPVAVSIKLSDYRMLNLRNEFFTFRHTTTDFTPVNPGTTTDNVTYGFGDLANTSSYIMDPKTFMKNTSLPVDINGVSYTDWVTNRGFGSIGAVTEHILGYCQENTMEKEAQKKGYGTAIVFKGKITVEGVTVTEGANLYYDKTNSVFYADYTALKAVFSSLSETVNYTELAANNIEAYKNGNCTYVYYIKHADNGNNKEMGVMEFAMVRNNVYKVAVTGVSAPGKGLVPNPDDPSNPLDPSDPTNPTDPDPSIDPAEDIETGDITIALKVKLTVKPWIVRNNDVELGR